MLGLNGLRLIQKRLSALGRTFPTIAPGCSISSISQTAHASASLIPDTMSPITATSSLESIVDHSAMSNLTIKDTIVPESQRSASGRVLDPRRISKPIAVAPMVDVTTSVNEATERTPNFLSKEEMKRQIVHW